jgi:hypothetical protein
MAASMIRWWLRAVVVYTLLGAAVIHAAQARSHDEGVGRVDPGSVSRTPGGWWALSRAAATMPRAAMWDADKLPSAT